MSVATDGENCTYSEDSFDYLGAIEHTDFFMNKVRYTLVKCCIECGNCICFASETSPGLGDLWK